MTSRKNDGVKMTSQFATKNTHALGMTTDNNTIDRYLKTRNPGKPSYDKRLEGALAPHPVVLRNGKWLKVKMVRYGDSCYYFLREDSPTGLGQRSITYGSKRRALQVYEAEKIKWWRETYSLIDGQIE